MDWKKIFDAIDVLHEQTALAKKEEPDDFNYEMLRQLNGYSQRTLYMLTRGERGEKCGFDLQVFPAEQIVNALQQLKAEIAALVAEFCDLYDGDLSGEAVSLLLTKLHELSANPKKFEKDGSKLPDYSDFRDYCASINVLIDLPGKIYAWLVGRRLQRECLKVFNKHITGKHNDTTRI